VLNLSLLNYIVVSRVTRLWLVDIFNGTMDWREMFGALVQFMTYFITCVVLSMEPREIIKAWHFTDGKFKAFPIMVAVLSCYILTAGNVLGILNAVFRSLAMTTTTPATKINRSSSCCCLPSFFFTFAFWQNRQRRTTRDYAMMTSILMLLNSLWTDRNKATATISRLEDRIQELERRFIALEEERKEEEGKEEERKEEERKEEERKEEDTQPLGGLFSQARKRRNND